MRRQALYFAENGNILFDEKGNFTTDTKQQG